MEWHKTLYARDVDGGYPVVVHAMDHIELVLPDNDPVVFTSSRQLLMTLTGSDRHWTFDRYFRLGRYSPKGEEVAVPDPEVMAGWLTEGGEDTGVGDPTLGNRPTERVAVVTGDVGVSRSVTVVPESLDPIKVALSVAQGVVGTEPELGIDLVNRADEVAKLLFAGFGQWIFGSGYDPDDVLQEVYKGILARNMGDCPWDARKSSFGHYVHMVCHGVLSNFHRKVKRQREFEAPGVRGFDSDGDWNEMDVGASQHLAAEPSSEEEAQGMVEAQDALTVFLEGSERAHTQDGKMAVRILPLVGAGFTRAEIAQKLGVSRASVSRGLTYLREQARVWQGQD